MFLFLLISFFCVPISIAIVAFFFAPKALFTMLYVAQKQCVLLQNYKPKAVFNALLHCNLQPERL